MQTIPSRAARGPLALTLLALTALVACVDDPVAPNTKAAKPKAPALDVFVDLTVTNTSGGVDVGSIRWAANQIGRAGGAIHFASALDGATIVLAGSLSPDGPMYVVGPDKGITLSGNNQYRVIDGYQDNGGVSLKNVTITQGYNAFFGSAVQATSLYLDNSTIQNSTGPGSAVRVRYGFAATNSTISQNAVGGPAIEYSELAYVTITNSTVAFNSGYGIGLYGPVDSNFQLLVVLNNSILSNNGQNCLSTSGLRYEGTNISSDWSCGAVGIGIGDPQLFPLANNGGPTKTHAIPYTSPARNTGVACFPTVDQRYVVRDAKCDVGAFEFNDFTRITLTIDPGVKLNANGSAQVTGTIKCTRNDSFRMAVELHQDQKIRGQLVDVHAATDITVNCTTGTQAWTAPMGLAAGQAFVAGAARATAQTFYTADWITPASTAATVKIRK